MATAIAPVTSTMTITKLYQTVRRDRMDQRHQRSRPGTSAASMYPSPRRVTMTEGCPGSSIFRRSRWTQTSITFDMASNGASHTCSAMSPRLDDFVGVQDQVLEQGVLPRRQRQWLPSTARTAGTRVQFEDAGAKNRGRWGPPAPANDGAEARQELAEIERLREIVVGAAVQAGDPRLDRVPRGQHQHGNRRSFLSNRTTHRETVLQRQHDIEDDRVVLGDGRLVHRAFAVAHDVHGVRLLAKALRQHLRRARFVFDKENPHGPRSES